MPITGCTESAPASIPLTEEHDYAASPLIVVDRIKYETMSREIEELRRQLESYHLTQEFGLQFPSYEHLMAFWNLIQEATSRMVRVTSGQKSLSTSTSTESPVNRPTKLLPVDELFLFLNYLATGCTQRELCHKFNIHRATVSRILVSWSNFLYTLLGSVSIWMAPGRVRANCPTDFSGTYKNTQVILDCTEMRCQTPSSLLLQSEVFSTYKLHSTLKRLLACPPMEH
ncbi:heat-stable enterotoxin receptor [Sarotherodon galilaeus]